MSHVDFSRLREVFGLCVVLIGLAVSPPFAGTAGQVLSRRWRTAGVMALMALMALGKKLRAFPWIRSNEFLNLFGYMSHEKKPWLVGLYRLTQLYRDHNKPL